MNAIILAAGMGSRLGEKTDTVPKPLVMLNEQTIIESQIALLHKNGIKDITIVTGYMNEQFDFLKEKHSVSIIVNELYNRANNIYSLYLAREKLDDTLIIEGDVAVFENFLQKGFSSGLFVRKTKEAVNEWQVIYNKKLEITDVIINGKGCHSYIGFTYLNEINSAILKKRLIEQIIKGNYHLMYWDEVIINHLYEFSLHANIISEHDCYEIDTISDYHKAIAASGGNIFRYIANI